MPGFFRSFSSGAPVSQPSLATQPQHALIPPPPQPLEPGLVANDHDQGSALRIDPDGRAYHPIPTSDETRDRPRVVPADEAMRTARLVEDMIFAWNEYRLALLQQGRAGRKLAGLMREVSGRLERSDVASQAIKPTAQTLDGLADLTIKLSRKVEKEYDLAASASTKHSKALIKEMRTHEGKAQDYAKRLEKADKAYRKTTARSSDAVSTAQAHADRLKVRAEVGTQIDEATRFHNGFCTSKQVLLGYQLGNAAGGMVSALMDHHADSVRKAGEKAGDAEYFRALCALQWSQALPGDQSNNDQDQQHLQQQQQSANNPGGHQTTRPGATVEAPRYQRSVSQPHPYPPPQVRSEATSRVNFMPGAMPDTNGISEGRGIPLSRPPSYTTNAGGSAAGSDRSDRSAGTRASMSSASLGSATVSPVLAGSRSAPVLQSLPEESVPASDSSSAHQVANGSGHPVGRSSSREQLQHSSSTSSTLSSTSSASASGHLQINDTRRSYHALALSTAPPSSAISSNHHSNQREQLGRLPQSQPVRRQSSDMPRVLSQSEIPDRQPRRSPALPSATTSTSTSGISPTSPLSAFPFPITPQRETRERVVPGTSTTLTIAFEERFPSAATSRGVSRAITPDSNTESGPANPSSAAGPAPAGLGNHLLLPPSASLSFPSYGEIIGGLGRPLELRKSVTFEDLPRAAANGTSASGSGLGSRPRSRSGLGSTAAAAAVAAGAMSASPRGETRTGTGTGAASRAQVVRNGTVSALARALETRVQSSLGEVPDHQTNVAVADAAATATAPTATSTSTSTGRPARNSFRLEGMLRPIDESLLPPTLKQLRRISLPAHMMQHPPIVSSRQTRFDDRYRSTSTSTRMGTTNPFHRPDGAQEIDGREAGAISDSNYRNPRPTSSALQIPNPIPITNGSDRIHVHSPIPTRPRSISPSFINLVTESGEPWAKLTSDTRLIAPRAAGFDG